MIKKLLITPIKKLSNPLGDIYLLAKSKNNPKSVLVDSGRRLGKAASKLIAAA